MMKSHTYHTTLRRLTKSSVGRSSSSADQSYTGNGILLVEDFIASDLGWRQNSVSRLLIVCLSVRLSVYLSGSQNCQSRIDLKMPRRKKMLNCRLLFKQLVYKMHVLNSFFLDD